jgi:Rieske Fe-S protein
VSDDRSISPCAGCAGLTPDATAQPVGLDRRTFLSQSALAALGIALAACAGGGGSDATAPQSVSLSLHVGDYPALATVGGVALVSASGSPLAVVRTATTGSDQFVALSRICPHQGATVNTLSTGFNCPRHGARFDSTGHWVGGQPTSNMMRYATTYDATSGTLTIG